MMARFMAAVCAVLFAMCFLVSSSANANRPEPKEPSLLDRFNRLDPLHGLDGDKFKDFFQKGRPKAATTVEQVEQALKDLSSPNKATRTAAGRRLVAISETDDIKTAAMLTQQLEKAITAAEKAKDEDLLGELGAVTEAISTPLNGDELRKGFIQSVTTDLDTFLLSRQASMLLKELNGGKESEALKKNDSRLRAFVFGIIAFLRADPPQKGESAEAHATRVLQKNEKVVAALIEQRAETLKQQREVMEKALKGSGYTVVEQKETPYIQNNIVKVLEKISKLGPETAYFIVEKKGRSMGVEISDGGYRFFPVNDKGQPVTAQLDSTMVQPFLRDFPNDGREVKQKNGDKKVVYDVPFNRRKMRAIEGVPVLVADGGLESQNLHTRIVQAPGKGEPMKALSSRAIGAVVDDYLNSYYQFAPPTTITPLQRDALERIPIPNGR